MAAGNDIKAMLKLADAFAKMVRDFRNMGTVEFCENYPGYRRGDGYKYIARKARDMADFAAGLPDNSQR